MINSTTATLDSFQNFIQLLQYSSPPVARVVKSTASTQDGHFTGALKFRLEFADLDLHNKPDEKGEYPLRVAIHNPHRCCGPLREKNYRLFSVEIDHQIEDIWINLLSLSHRLNLPQGELRLYSLNTLLEVSKQKILFEDQKEEAPENSIDTPLLSLEKMRPLLPIEQIINSVKIKNRCLRLSRHFFSTPYSIEIHAQGFVAFNTLTREKKLGEGRNAQVKIYTTLEQTKVARRGFSFNPGDSKYSTHILKLIKTLSDFKNTKGVLHTYSMGFYKNKNGQCKFSSFHPLYDASLYEFFENVFEKGIKLSLNDQLNIMHNLLEGLDSIHARGTHGDLKSQNMLIRKTPSGGFEAVISDLEWFTSDQELEDSKSNTPQNQKVGAEKEGKKQEVWKLGNEFYYMLTNRHPFWNYPDLQQLDLSFYQKKLNEALKTLQSSPLVKELLNGMLAIDPEQRWIASQALLFFKKTLLTLIRDPLDKEDFKESPTPS